MSENPSGAYDPVNLFHWLWWSVRCLKASASEFQNLFEQVASKLWPDFVKVRPYGRIGDRKSDGLLWGDGTCFQVYSPDELRQRETVAKIEEDLDGAVHEWGPELKRWVFVYNTRRGLAPDIPRVLMEQRAKYPGIVIEPLSSEALWEEMLEHLTLQQRSEVLGAPAGYGDLFALPGADHAEIEALWGRGRILLIQDVLSPIDVRDAASAVAPEVPFGPPMYVRPAWPAESWLAAAAEQSNLVDDLLTRSRNAPTRFAIFSLAPIPLAIHLGQLLSDRVDALLFQYDRERRTWCWGPDADSSADIRMDGVPVEEVHDAVEVIVRISLSADVDPTDTVIAAGDCPVQIDLHVENPDVMWLRHPGQLDELERIFRNILKHIGRAVPKCERIHLFYAGPAGGAVAIGRAVNPRMHPSIALYEYRRNETPRYEHVITLGGESAQKQRSGTKG